MDSCKNCGHSLVSWNKFKDMRSKEGTTYAVLGTIFNGLKHEFTSSIGYRQDCDEWSTELYFCEHCTTYFMKCPKCDHLLPLSVMPKNGKTLVVCNQCGHRTLYAGNYDTAGGG